MNDKIKELDEKLTNADPKEMTHQEKMELYALIREIRSSNDLTIEGARVVINHGQKVADIMMTLLDFEDEINEQ